MTTTTPVRKPGVEGREETDAPWVVIVWDDPVNLMDYVVFVFQEVFGFTKSKARKLMLHVQRLQSYGLWATMEQ